MFFYKENTFFQIDIYFEFFKYEKQISSEMEKCGKE